MSFYNVVGAYVLTHLPSGKYYIGSSGDVMDRLERHRQRLNRGVHENINLSQVFTTWSDMQWEIHPTSTLDRARDLEQQLLDQHLGQALCCNIGQGSRHPWYQGQVPDRVKAAVAKANTGLKRSEETLERMRNANRDNPLVKASLEKAYLVSSKRVSVDGIIYASVSQASKALGCNRRDVVKRVNSDQPRFSNWKMVE